MARIEDYADMLEISTRLQIHPQSVRRLIKQGKLPAQLVFGKYVVERSVLEMWATNYDPTPGHKHFPSLRAEKL